MTGRATPYRVAPFVDDGDVQLYHGDVVDVLRQLPAGLVQTVVTSPPYWGLRDYQTGSWAGGNSDCDHVERMARGDSGRPATEVPRGKGGAMVPSGTSQPVDSPIMFRDQCGRCGARRVDQQLGLEATPTAYVERMVAVFREVWRVLRDDGTVWLNLGDSYNGSGGAGGNANETRPAGMSGAFNVSPNRLRDRTTSAPTRIDGLKPKDLVGIPWRVAFALQADGWYLRSDIIWSKPNPMPESVSDRPTKAHEYLFLLAKRPRYYFDQDAIREDISPHNNGTVRVKEMDGYRSMRDGLDNSRKQTERTYDEIKGRNRRSVWTIPTEPFPEAHFATYPQELVRPCILAGTSERGECGECGAPWQRQVERTDERIGENRGGNYGGVQRTDGTKVMLNGYRAGSHYVTIDHGWQPSCQCANEAADDGRKVPETRPQTVLDPFIGSGTTALVARKHGRRCIGIDLSAEYLEIAARRLQQLSLFAVEPEPASSPTARPRGLTGGAYSPPGQAPHSNARKPA